MKTNSLDVQGALHAQRVSTLPVWEASDEGRIIYALDTHKFYIGSNAAWVEAPGTASGGGNTLSLLRNSTFGVWTRGSQFDTYNSFRCIDKAEIADRWTLLIDGDNSIMCTRIDDAQSKLPVVLRVQQEVANKQYGFLQVITRADSYWLRGKTVSIRLRAKRGSGGTPLNVRCGLFAILDTFDSNYPDIVSAWAGGGTNPTWRSWAYLINTPANLALSTSWAEHKIEGISIPTYFGGPGFAGLGVFVWVDDTTIAYGRQLFLSEIDLIQGTTFSEPVRLAQPYEFQKTNLPVIPTSGDDYNIGGTIPTPEVVPIAKSNDQLTDYIRLLVHNGFASSLSSDRRVVIRASEYIRSIYYSSNKQLTFGMRKSGSGIGFPVTGSNIDPSKVTLTYTDADVGVVSIEIWATDGTLLTMSESYILVQDPMGYTP